MTTYAEVHGTTLIQYPYGFDQLQAENPFTNYGSNSDFVSIFPGTDTAIKNGYTLAPVTISVQPTFNPLTQICTQNAAPTLIDGVWTLGWTVTAMTTGQEQAAAETAGKAAYNTAIAAGIQITSTATPALNGTYSLAQTQVGVITSIAAGLGGPSPRLPGGGSTFVYIDPVIGPKTFTAAQFISFADALEDYIYALQLFAAGQGSQPSSSVTIP